MLASTLRPAAFARRSCTTLAGRVDSTKAEVIRIARMGKQGVGLVPHVLDVARATDDRQLFGVCLDCFSAVLEDSTAPIAYEVATFLGGLLPNREFRRIRRRILTALYIIGRASSVVLPNIVVAYKERGPSSILVPVRWAAVHVSWEALASPDPQERRAGLDAFLDLGSLGLLNLRAFLEKQPAHADSVGIKGAIRELESRYPGEYTG